jgi:putative aminopeptidase FrvX
MTIHQMLKEMSELFGVTGFEEEVRAYIKDKLNGLVDEFRVDVLGNILGFKKGKTEKTLLLDAHIDEVGFLVT